MKNTESPQRPTSRFEVSPWLRVLIPVLLGLLALGLLATLFLVLIS